MKNFFGWFKSSKFLMALFLAVPLVLLFPSVMLFFWPSAKAQVLEASLFVRLAVTLGWLIPVWIQVEAFMGVTRAFFGRETRSYGSGLRFLFQPFGVSIETVVREDDIVRTPLELEMTAEASNRDAVMMKIVIETETKADALVNHNRMDDGKREKGIKDRAEGIMTAEVYKCLGREDVYKTKATVEASALAAIKDMRIGDLLLEDYFGQKINSIAIADIIQPKGIVEAEQEREKAEELAKADLVRTQAFKDRVDLLQVGHPNEKRGGKLTRQQAFATELILSGKSKKEEKVIDIGPNLQHSLGAAGRSVGSAGKAIGPALVPVVEWLATLVPDSNNKKPKNKKKKGS